MLADLEMQKAAISGEMKSSSKLKGNLYAAVGRAPTYEEKPVQTVVQDGNEQWDIINEKEIEESAQDDGYA